MDAPTIESPPPEPTEPVPGPPGPSATAPRRLTRSPDQRLLGGVAGGLAEYLGVDPVIVRLGFVVTAFFGGLGVIAYVIGWIALPVGAAPTRGRRGSAPDRKQLVGYGLVALGLVAVGGRIGWSVRGDGIFWPLVLIGLGAAVLVLRARDAAQGPPDPPTDPPTDPEPPGGPTAPMTATVPATDPGTAPMTGPVPAAAAHPERPKSYLGALTWSALLVLVGGAWLLDAAGLGRRQRRRGGRARAGARRGRARDQHVARPVTWADRGRHTARTRRRRARRRRRTTRRRHREPDLPTAHAGAVERSYALGIGDLSLDLRAVDFSGTRRHVDAQLGIGQLNVTVPDDVRVVLDGHVGAGSVSAFGRQSTECCPTDVHVVRPGVAGGGTLVLDADVGAGNIRIKREENLRGTS